MVDFVGYRVLSFADKVGLFVGVLLSSSSVEVDLVGNRVLSFADSVGLDVGVSSSLLELFVGCLVLLFTVTVGLLVGDPLELLLVG